MLIALRLNTRHAEKRPSARRLKGCQTGTPDGAAHQQHTQATFAANHSSSSPAADASVPLQAETGHCQS
jgi:hypothetical protein